jgi:ADP-dependent NAD(P)H-hydrate dehydratase / NAD(P)H-hydrate epimerase
MKVIVNSKQMRQIDQYIIEEVGIPGVVLMERAALAVTQAVTDISGYNDRILIICGTGNNGADGIAVGRLLKLQERLVDILIVGDMIKGTQLFKLQLDIAKNLGISIYNKLELNEYTIIVDAIFGVGLNRSLDDTYINLIEQINATGKKIVSVDIPSGLSADTGKVMGAAIKASKTVTFGFQKLGLTVYPGCEMAGKLEVADIGVPEKALQSVGYSGYIYEKQDLKAIPCRKSNSNKGTFGKVLVIAGSKDIYGACYFSAKAAYKTGAGLVRVVTPSCNKVSLNINLPEALIYNYNSDLLEEMLFHDLSAMMDWASVIVMGPGMGFTTVTKAIFEYVIQNVSKPLLLDADAIRMLGDLANICLKDDTKDEMYISNRIEYFNCILPDQTILTPHMKELADLLKLSVVDIKRDVLTIANTCTTNNNLIYVLKDARTIVAQGKNRYINVSGNSGMATGGSGDILTGIIAGLIAQGLDQRKASELGVYIHGLAGDIGKEKLGEYALLANDIIDMLPDVMSGRV